MTYYCTYIRDILNNNYIGIKIPNEIVQPYLNFLKEEIGEDNYALYTENQQKRDRGDYHITVLNVMEFNKLNKELGMDKFVNSLDAVFKYEIDDLKLKGVGTATKNENRAYFIVCESEKLNAIRIRYELEPRDFHVTLGFSPRDVFGVRKNEVTGSTEVINPFEEQNIGGVIFRNLNRLVLTTCVNNNDLVKKGALHRFKKIFYVLLLVFADDTKT
jgi:hypothetical protein